MCSPSVQTGPTPRSTRPRPPPARRARPDVPRNFAKRLDSVAPSATLAMNARAAELRGRGVDVFPFGVGEPDFEPPAFVLEAAKAAIDEARLQVHRRQRHRPSEAGHLRGDRAQPRVVPVAAPGLASRRRQARALQPRRRALRARRRGRHPGPVLGQLPRAGPAVGGHARHRADDGGRRLEACRPSSCGARSRRATKAVILCSPSNPTGAAYDEAETRALLDVLRAHDCWLIVDEIYAELVYDGFRYVSAARIAPESFPASSTASSSSTASPSTYAMTGWRIGWCIAPPALANALDMVQGQSTTNADRRGAARGRRGAERAAGGDERGCARVFEARRNVMVAGLRAITGMPLSGPRGGLLRVRRLHGALRRRAPRQARRRTTPTSRSGCSRRPTSPPSRGAPSQPRGYSGSATRPTRRASRAGLASIQETLARSRSRAG